jgi:hypothetical protein
MRPNSSRATATSSHLEDESEAVLRRSGDDA